MSQRQKMNIKYYTDIDITFCRQRSLSLSFPSLNNINFFPPIILPQPSSNGRTHTVSQSTLREPSFFKVTEPSYVRNRNSISEFQTDHCTYRVKLILWHRLSYLFIHVSLPLVLEAFSITPLPVLSQTIFFPFVIPLCFSELIYNSPTCPLMTALRMGGSWPVLTHTHSELRWLPYCLFFYPVFPAFAPLYFACKGIQMQPASTPGSWL